MSHNPTLSLSICRDTYTAVPALLGRVPVSGVAVIAMVGDEVTSAVLLALPTRRSLDDFAGEVVDRLFAGGANACVLAAYGDPDRADRALQAAINAATDWDVLILDAMHVTEDSYVSGFCVLSPDCSTGGHPVPGTASRDTPGRLDCGAAVPEAGPGAGGWLAAAFDAELARLADLIATDTGQACARIHAEAVNLLDEYATTPELAPEQVAGMLLALIHPRVRDHALMLTDNHGPKATYATWAHLARVAPPGFAAAPSCLAGFAAWRLGDHTAAREAVERGLADEPDAVFARFLRQVLDVELPTGALPALDHADTAPIRVTRDALVA